MVHDARAGVAAWMRTFARLMRAEAFRIAHGRGVWAALVVMGCMIGGAVVSREGASGFGLSIAVVLVVCIPFTCANDLDAGGMKSLLVGAHARTAYVAVLVVLAVGLGLAGTGVARLAVTIAGALGYGDGVKTSNGAWMVWTVLYVLIYVTPALWVAILTRSQPFATLVAFLVASPIPWIILADGLDALGWKGLSRWMWEQYPLGMEPGYEAVLPNEGIWIIAGAGIVVWTALSLWAMSRRDVSVHGE